MSQETRKTPFIKFLTAAGTPATIEHSLDYSGGSADVAVLTPDSGSSYYEVDELTFDVVFGASSINYAQFFGITALTNGLEVKILNADDDELVDLTDGLPMKDTHAFFLRSISPMITTLMDSFDPDRHHARVIWRFEKPIILRAGDTLEITLDDDLSGAALISLHIQASGRKVATV